MRNKVVIKIANLAVLSALGFGLMMLGQILRYPPAPFLELEPSDTVILVGYAMYGFQGALLVAIIKTLLYLLITGPVGPIAIGQLTAFLTSLTYCLGLFLTAKVFKLFKRGLPGRIASYVIITVVVACVLTVANFLFMTPTFILNRPATFLSAWNFDFGAAGINIKGAYPIVIVLLYIPFNLLKGVIVCALYEIVFNRVIFHLLKTDRRFKTYFTGSLFSLKKATEDDVNQPTDGSTENYFSDRDNYIK